MATARPTIAIGAVRGFLGERFANVRDVVAIRSGEWSSAYACNADDNELVVRFGRYREDYEKDRLATDWSTADLPIPRVVDIGEAFGVYYAISERADGAAFDVLAREELEATLPSMVRVLEATRAVALPGEGYGIWSAPLCNAPSNTWAQFLVSVRDGNKRFGPWREQLAAVPDAADAYHRAVTALDALVTYCGNERGLIHGDLLAGNTLVKDRRVSAVLDWGNALAGDPLYDLAWLTMWSPWHPGLEGILDAARALYRADHFEERLRCYELHIGIDGLQYTAAVGRVDEIGPVAERLSSLAT